MARQAPANLYSNGHALTSFLNRGSDETFWPEGRSAQRKRFSTFSGVYRATEPPVACRASRGYDASPMKVSVARVRVSFGERESGRAFRPVEDRAPGKQARDSPTEEDHHAQPASPDTLFPAVGTVRMQCPARRTSRAGPLRLGRPDL